MADINLNNLDGIPFGINAGRPANPQPGQPYFNGESNRLEIYTESVGWQNIVQETPAVVNIIGALNENATSTLTINGTNFAVGANVFAVGTNGIEYACTSSTLISVVQMSAIFPALSATYEPYDIKVVNPSNLYGVLYEALTVDNVPSWTTGSGSIGTYIEQSPMSVTVSATDPVDPYNSPLIYSISSGSLPPGLSINSSTGVISGTPGNVASSTLYNFTAAAYDGRNPAVTRNFSMTITDRGPSWSTSATLPTFTRNSSYSTTLVAVDEDNNSISYSLFSGSLPTGLSLASNGTISGTPTSATIATFTVRATDSVSSSYSDRQFTMPNAGPTWSTSGTLSIMLNGSAYSVQLSASDDSGVAPTYSLISGTFPTGITLSSSGLISGTPSGIVGFTNTNYTFRVTDANGLYADQTLVIPLNEAIYAFTSHTFTNAGVIGKDGPTLSQCRSSYSSTSWANTYLDMSTQGYQLWTVPASASYRITAAGARGGNGGPGTSGTGAIMAGTFSLTAGSVIKILVGQQGVSFNNGSSSGGGGSFVVNSSNSPYIIAGGGGGNGKANSGSNATVSTNANGAVGSGGAGGTTSGGGAGSNADHGGGGGGGVPSGSTGGTPAGGGGLGAAGGAGFGGNGGEGQNDFVVPLSFLNGGTGGYRSGGSYGTIAETSGGFGGGANGTNYTYSSGGGGGGGYTGGGGGTGLSSGGGGGGGGGSYNGGSSPSNSVGNAGHGYVTITKL